MIQLFEFLTDNITEDQARQLAIDWQVWASQRPLSYEDLAVCLALFEKLGERFGLTEEFKENGVI